MFLRKILFKKHYESNTEIIPKKEADTLLSRISLYVVKDNINL